MPLNLSTSSSNSDEQAALFSQAKAWKRALKLFLAVVLLALLGLVGVIVYANPYRNIPFASTNRPLMDVNQRYLYPAVVRDLGFDSGVFGNSTIRLLRPEALQGVFGGSFAQLAMNSGTAYETYLMADFFLRYRQEKGQPTRTLVFGLDAQWCSQEPTYPQFTERGFPLWMLDESPWNDLPHMFNGKVVEIAGRILGQRLGFGGKIHYDQSGYGSFLPPIADYDLAKARRHIYGQETPIIRPAVEPAVQVSADVRQGWQFSTHTLLKDLLAKAPAESGVILIWVPYHAYIQPAVGSQEAVVQEVCKERVAKLAALRPHTMVVDFMRPSVFTRTDQNYWDSLHYGLEQAEQVVSWLGLARSGRVAPDGIFHLDDPWE